MQTETLTEGCFYHIYNRGINGTTLFTERGNYEYFLRLYEKYIDPVAETYAWCLMPNHFHLLVYVKTKDEIEPKQFSYSTVKQPKEVLAWRQFSHLFNAYTQAFNRRNSRTGGLFESPFERKKVDKAAYFHKLVYYIHNNPVKHGFCERLQDYPWSSYGTIVSFKPTKLQREKILGYFDSLGNFIDYHKQKHDMEDLLDII